MRPPGHVAGEGLFRLLLLAYPPSFRHRHGEQMALYFRDSRRAAAASGKLAVVRLWGRVLVDWSVAVPRERGRERTRRRRGLDARGTPKMGGTDLLATIGQDVRYGVRMLRRTPSVAVVAVATLALGIGSATAVFSVVNEVVLRTLPYPNPDGLVYVDIGRTLAKATVDRLRREADLFEEVSGFSGWGFTLTGQNDPIELSGGHVSSNYFVTLGVNAALGRTLLPGDEAPDGSGVAVISHGLWTRQFGRDSSVIGRTVTLGGAGKDSRAVIGVMPEGYETLRPDWDVWVPLEIDLSNDPDYGQSWYLRAFGRLRPGVTVGQASEQINALAARLGEDQPRIFASDDVATAGGVPLHDVIVGSETRVALLVLMGAVSLVLLVACTNVANLLLVRAGARQREFAIRAALGAGRSRVARQLLTESVILGGVGGVVGLLLAVQAVALVGDRLGEHVSRSSQIGVDMRVLGFSVLLSVGAALLFGVVPALTGSRIAPQEQLRVGRQGDRRRFRINGWLVVGEIALATVLVVGAGLLLKSFWRLQQVPPGFDSDGVVTMRVTLPTARYHEFDQWRQYYHDALERVRALPGVRAAGAIHLLPLTEGNWGFPYAAQDHPVDPDVPLPSANYRVVAPGYFQTMRIPLLSGRSFSEDDRDGRPQVTIINRTMAQELWPDESPIGKEIRLFDDDDLRFRVVGVVGDVRQHRLDLGSQPEMYYTLQQRPMGQMIVVTRTDPEAVSPAAVQSAIWSVDPNVPISRVAGMRDVVSRTLADQRLVAWMLTAFAGVSLALGAVGVYGVTSYVIGQRTREIGIRLALGAERRRVIQEVLLKGMTPAAIGVVLGGVGALATGRAASGLLYGVSPHDPATFGSVVTFLFVVALMACWVPARRAARVDPTESLRQD